jgi:hypothetical protein
MSRDRLLVIDADVSKRLAQHLIGRARDAISLHALDLARDVKDGQVLRSLAGLYNGERDWVLVTGDDAMPAEHGAVIIETSATIATIHPAYPAEELTEHNWRIDVVQRWAHRIQLQEPQTVRRYSLTGSEIWRPRRRHLRDIDLHGWTPWDAKRIDSSRDTPPTRPTRLEPVQHQLPGFAAASRRTEGPAVTAIPDPPSHATPG